MVGVESYKSLSLSYKFEALDGAEVTKPGAIAEPNGVC
jgi:hypothetical protein